MPASPAPLSVHHAAQRVLRTTANDWRVQPLPCAKAPQAARAEARNAQRCAARWSFLQAGHGLAVSY